MVCPESSGTERSREAGESKGLGDPRKMYFLYILRTSSDDLYIGVTENLERRLDAHNHKSPRLRVP
jgi:hypothetical protein